MSSTRIYVDTSAAAKLFIAESETRELRHWLASRSEPSLVSSALLGVELIRLLNLVSPTMIGPAEAFLATDVDIVEIVPPVLADATRLPPRRLRTLDAIHLATALDLKDSLDVILTYDELLLEAARMANLAVASPGAPY